jgi:sterol desaturase/sphingolipid hydroxylase (fatty acid hydroxylase superfamily)
VDLSPGLLYFWTKFSTLCLSLGAHFSFTSLGAALIIAVVFYTSKRLRRGRRVRWKTIRRALFPKRIVHNPSTYTDLGYMLFNVFVYGIVFGWAVLTYQAVTNGIIAAMVELFGKPAPSMLPPVAANSILTLILFLAYEFGYWFNHWLSHRVPVLWEFHKVHHSAEVLTPLTNFRVHPIYSWIFANILALSAAIANGFANYWLGNAAYQYALADTNIILVFFIHVYVHLQHSHIWIPFTGLLGRILVSPAHHQIHHSKNPKHFNRNFGSCLALWDWVFGTLYVPGKEPEKIEFGVEPDHFPAHTITGELIAPFIRAFALVRVKFPRVTSRVSRRARSA